MKTHIPTITELDCKSARELHAIFQSAAKTSANTKLAEAERAAARKTEDNIRRVLAGRHLQP